MTGIQTFLVLGSLILFTILVLNVNKTIMGKQTLEIGSEAINTASAVGQSVITEINSKAYDEYTITNQVYSELGLTVPNLLGPELGETISTYDDVDDYNNYSKVDSTPRIGVFSINVKVNYVNENNVTSILNIKSRTKRVEVAVFNSSLEDTFKLYTYKSY